MLRATVQVDDRVRERFASVRSISGGLVKNLSDGDTTAQSMPDASPSKWHLAHTTWFFESFVLSDFIARYRPFNARFSVLFNSYYEAKGTRIARSARGTLTRPSLQEILEYRAYVDAAVFRALDCMRPSVRNLVELGCHHEEQHQELLLTDLLHLFSLRIHSNPHSHRRLIERLMPRRCRCAGWKGFTAPSRSDMTGRNSRSTANGRDTLCGHRRTPCPIGS